MGFLADGTDFLTKIYIQLSELERELMRKMQVMDIFTVHNRLSCIKVSCCESSVLTYIDASAAGNRRCN